MCIKYNVQYIHKNYLFRHMFLGHDMSVSDFDGRTPLHLAAAEGHLECVKFLLQSSCEVPVEPTDRYGLGILFTKSMILNYAHFGKIVS